ncbi:streptolysin S family bacteriocin [Streptomyces anulatus]|uniref:streptolysin S family bacteriocin n=1 Tax=Streptomyces TaxID=1883 RepID=UPI000BF21899|nr:MULTISPECIES: streptolysin S family bacteriocin [Streptomyces]QYA97677.1 streptolysin S family bacteriocin [Streptomyces anulatus]UPT45534.1 streptolysin S family bacteriocin [Streptomyces sp. WAC00303]UPT45535.1 streptolysin S family bacteriocin [Streptomyces sp. WAC00303]WIY79660.1 streptolysin S family bacteriocin [Streptomyces anulatus]WIY79661.1 streptolysin S family bacteriocin [Streptomyces anulatus]
MADYRISNLTIRVEDQTLPKGVIQGQGKYVGDLNLGKNGPLPMADCGCTCSCTCSCTCTSTGGGSHSEEQLVQLQEVELTVLKESLKAALSDLEEIQQSRGSR